MVFGSGVLEEPCFLGGVFVHGSVALQVIGRDVEHDGDIGCEIVGLLDLIAADFDDDGRVFC